MSNSSASSYSAKGVMILPVVKLGTLALRTICKPIANRIKIHAGVQPRFRQFIVNFAQANHRLTTNMQRRIYGRATDVAIRPLNEERAVQASADLLGELFLFSVAGLAIIYEVQRNSKSEAKKEALRKQELEAIKKRDEDLEREVKLLKQKISVMEAVSKIRSFNGTLDLKNSDSSEDQKKQKIAVMEAVAQIQSSNGTFDFKSSHSGQDQIHNQA